MTIDPRPRDRCEGCGLTVAGGVAGCQAIMDRLLALHFGDVAYFGSHRLFVDAYSLQHPDRYCVSFKSLAAHAMHLCWSLEHGGSRAIPSAAIRRWLERHPGLHKPELPAFRGPLTIAEVAATGAPAEHHHAVERWARATWEAHRGLHPEVRRWVELALVRARAGSAGR